MQWGPAEAEVPEAHTSYATAFTLGQNDRNIARFPQEAPSAFVQAVARMSLHRLV